MALSPRSSAILVEILDAHSPVHIRDITERYAISERTAKYDIQAIRGWLAKRGIELRSKPGAGMSVELADRDRIGLVEELAATAMHASHDVRSHVIALVLALAEEPVPINQLAERFEVSRSTLIGDLGQITPRNEGRDRPWLWIGRLFTDAGVGRRCARGVARDRAPDDGSFHAYHPEKSGWPRSGLLCRPVAMDDWCHRRGCHGQVRGSVIQGLAHVPFGCGRPRCRCVSAAASARVVGMWAPGHGPVKSRQVVSGW